MAEIILGTDTNPGGRKYNEDRCGTDSFVTRGGLSLAVGVVCDGVGGEERGERAAQLAIDTLFAFLRDSDITETPRLLNAAVKAANLAAYNEAQRLNAGERMACTLVAAVIENGQTLYVANVGDSRIYLVREGRLLQLTRDHTFANVMVWMGKLSPQAAASNPDASKVMRVLGTKPDVQVDLGMYLTTSDYGEANKIGRAGMALKTGDSVLVCSDGLVKDTATTGQPLVQEREIAQVLQTEEGPKAARGIMSIALGRIPVGEPVDNITLALLQTEDPSRAVQAARLQHLQDQKRQSEVRRKMAIIAAGVAIPLCLILLVTLAAFAGFFNIVTASAGGTSTKLAEATAIAQAQTETVAAYTPTPTTPPPTNTPVPTTVPTLTAGEIGKLFYREKFLEVLVDDKKVIAVPSGETRFIGVQHRADQAETGNIHLLGATRLQLSAVTDAKFQVKVFPKGDVFLQTGPYANGAEIELAGLPVVTRIRAGCMAVYHLDENTLLASCFKGECGYSLDFGVKFEGFAVGQQIQMQLKEPKVTKQQQIPQPDALKYWGLLSETSAGRRDALKCGVAPPPTPTHTPPPTLPPSPVPSTSGGGDGGATDGGTTAGSTTGGTTAGSTTGDTTGSTVTGVTDAVTSVTGSGSNAQGNQGGNQGNSTKGIGDDPTARRVPGSWFGAIFILFAGAYIGRRLWKGD